MFKTRKAIGAVFLTIGLLAAQSVAAIEIKTPRGTATIEQVPKRVAVLDVVAIDTIDSLGIKPVGLPEKLFVNYLDHLMPNTQTIGSLFKPDFEAINAMQPDLMIIGGRSSKQYDAIKKIAPTIDMTIWGKDIVGQAKARLSAYGALFNKEAKAQEIAKIFDEKIAKTKAAIKGKGKALIVMTNGPKISAYGATGRFGWLHEALEIPEAIENVEEQTHGEAISFEFIRDVNPDWLIVIDRTAAIGQKGASAKQTLDNALVQQTKAWSKNQVVYLNAANIYIASGGIQSMTKTMDELMTAFSKAN
ncbi:MAG: siderophore ABC transporter substrate-binding protein [Cohaesibacter sp.]|nr:siderophore ABC transporter substrate-binding protein [Cohaesibacter sp.]